MRFRGRREEGASLVEVGLILPFLIMLAIGLSEIGFLVIDYITVTNAARSGARTGAAAANAADADDLILNVVEEAACNLQFGALSQVTIFHPNSNGSIPEVGGVPDPSRVNIFVPGASGLQCGNDAHGLILNNGGSWASVNRNRIPPNLITIGVEVVFTHSSVTNLFPMPTVVWREVAIMQIEPDTRN